MKRSTMPGLCALAALLLFGCDHSKQSLAGGADAEAAGNLTEAAAQYRAVCDKGSSLCPIATRRLERINLVEAEKAFASGDFRKAKAAINLGVVSHDDGVKRAADVMNKLPDLENGLALEEASASAKPDEALAAMEKLAAAGGMVSSKAGEWLSKNRPRILLDRIKVACTPAGAGSCVELGRELARLHPTSPESAEAIKLVEADYTRIFPLLQKAESLLGQQGSLFALREKIRWCMWDKTNQAADDSPEGHNYSDPKESFRAECASALSPAPLPDIEKAWAELLSGIHDPGFTKPLGERLTRATNQGLYEREDRAKPGGSKK